MDFKDEMFEAMVKDIDNEMYFSDLEKAYLRKIFNVGYNAGIASTFSDENKELFKTAVCREV